MTNDALAWEPLAAHLTTVIRDRWNNDEEADCFELNAGGEDYLGRMCAQAALAFLDLERVEWAWGDTASGWSGGVLWCDDESLPDDPADMPLYRSRQHIGERSK